MANVSRIIRPEPILFVLWANELIQFVWSPPVLQTAAGWLMIVFVVLSLPRIRRGTVYLCVPLAVLTAGLTLNFDRAAGVMRGFQDAAVFMAFFGSIVLLRTLADRRPEISRARDLFTSLRTEQINGAFLVGAHVIGSILVIGVMAILAPVLKHDADALIRRRAAEVSQRGMCLAPLWSPFWIASAFATQQLPGVPAWEIMSLGLAMAAIGMVLAHIMYARDVGLSDLWRALLGFAPIVPTVALCAALITGLSAVAGLSTLKALIATIPFLAVLTLIAASMATLRAVTTETWRGSSRISDEIIVVTAALVLGRVSQVAIGEIGIGETVAALTIPTWGVIASVIFIMTLASLVGIHQLVSMIVVLVIVVPLDTGVNDTILMEAALIGWAFASMIGLTAVSTATASAMFGVPRIQLIFGPNLAFAAVFGALSVLLLSLVNSLFFAA
ncbi:MAG TPA: hypothetical protein DEV64_08625 [Rhodospirillaceae bacterium]|nr:hypothetical protein [Rhodospirillaceae bacterium]